MSLKKELKRGDWVKATNVRAPGSILEGQATHDMALFGRAQLELILGDNGERVSINVNYWDVEIIRKNLLTGGYPNE